MARTSRFGKRIKRAVTVPVLVLAGMGVAVGLSACSDSSGPSDRSDSTRSTTVAQTSTTTQRRGVTHDFVIPSGTAKRVANKEETGIFPRRLDVHIGDRIRVRNDDTEIARLGIFDVGPGETMTMTFREVGVLTGVIFGDDAGGCGSPPPEEKKFIINVRP